VSEQQLAGNLSITATLLKHASANEDFPKMVELVALLVEKQIIAIAANFSKGVFESATLFDQSVLSAVIWAHVQYSHHQLEVNSQT